MNEIAVSKFKEQCLVLLDLIAATSLVHGGPLLTRDRRIRRSRIVPLA